MNLQFKKNDEVYVLQNWNGEKGTVYIRTGIVKSWGKKQATIFMTDSEDMAKEMFYTEYINKYSHGLTIIPKTNDADAEDKALEVSKAHLKYTEESYRERYENEKDTNKDYAVRMLEISNTAKETEPSLLWYRDTEFCEYQKSLNK